jgi:hypothetical protein
MKRFSKLYSIIPLLFLLSIGNQLTPSTAVATAPAIPSDYSAPLNQIGQATASAAPSVHEMFKDVPQDELLQMMEEGQQFIKYLEENGTPEEKMAFAQAMEETLQGFTEDDWKEFEQIVETVQDKLPPLTIEPKETPVVEPVKQEAPKKEEPKIIVDNSLEKVLHAIHKAINAILLKAKSDKILTERITIAWDNKDNFNEMARLLQTLNKKDHIIKLTTSKDDAIKSLLESIQNFNKRLQIENDQLVIADTFGLQTDEKTTAANLKKLNKILEFFDSAIESLLPKLVKFIEEYEPDALKKAKDHDDDAKKALEHATKIEKQKRPIGSMSYSDKSPSHGSQNNRNQNRGYNQGGAQGSQPTSREQVPGHLEQAHRNNLKNVPQLKKSSPFDKNDPTEKDSDDKKKENIKDAQYNAAIDSLESYLETNTNKEVGTYMTAIGKASGIYSSFGTPINETDTNRFDKLQAKKSTATSLDSEESRFLQKYEEQWQKANDNFAKNTQAAHTYYSDLRDSIVNISPQIDEMAEVIQTIKASITQMNSKELEKLNASPALKSFAQRINSYYTTFRNVQHELKNKHRINKIHRETPNHYSNEERAYDDLVTKVENLHGLDRKIAETKSQLDSLHKSIKSAIAKRKREENKAASAK